MSKEKKIKIIISIVCISFLQGLQYTVSPVLSQIQEHYPKVDVSLVQMLITVPSLLAMVIAVISGWLVIKISKKHLLLIASLVAGLSGIIPLFADSFGLLFFSRAFYGVGLGLATALNTAVVADFFEGKERVSVMGIQAASVGAGMFIETTLSGLLGSYGFQYVNYVHLIGFISLILLAMLLPDTGKAKVSSTDRIKLNKRVFLISLLGAVEFLFLISFTTNISMHMQGALAGSTSVSGTLTGLFSGSQIVMGLVLGYVTKMTRKYTLPVAMLSFGLGAILLVLFPANLAMLMIGSVLCGFSQGMFIPQAMCEVANAVNPVATAMASACFTCAMCIGQLASPTVLNTASRIVFGEVTTTYVYLLSAIGITMVAFMVVTIKARKGKVVSK